MSRTLVIDGTFFLYRNFHSPSDGWGLDTGDLRTRGVFLFLRSLHQALEHVSDIGRVVVVWDGRRSARRSTLYPEYKANRDNRPPVLYEGKEIDLAAAFSSQRELLNEVLPLLGVRTVCLPDKEGDDVIYAISRLVGRSVIVSDDKDMLAMLRTTINVYRPRDGEYYTWANFGEEYGFDPDVFIYYKAIVGDTSDNIKGVNGAGKKTATTFCQLVQARDKSLDAALAEAAVSHDARLAKIAHQSAVLFRNVQLIDCAYEPFSTGEMADLKARVFNQVVEPGRSHALFLVFCDKFRFASLAGDVWFMPFQNLL